MENTLLNVSFNSETLKSLIREVVADELANFKPAEREKEDGYLTRKETAKMLRISLVTLNEHTKSGVLKGFRLNGKVLYKESDIQDALKQIVTSKYQRP